MLEIDEGAVPAAIVCHPRRVVSIGMSEPLALVVGIGASAGGLAAFKTFLRHTPADTGMAFVLVQHLDPHHKSLLVELLGAQKSHSCRGRHQRPRHQTKLRLRHPT